MPAVDAKRYRHEIPIPDPATITSIRIDPGDKPGMYYIHKVYVLQRELSNASLHDQHLAEKAEIVTTAGSSEWWLKTARQGAQRILRRPARYLWRHMPLTPKAKNKFKSVLFSRFPSIFAGSRPYDDWRKELDRGVTSSFGLPTLKVQQAGLMNPSPLTVPRLVGRGVGNYHSEPSHFLDISVVTYNSSTWLDQFFESLLQQEYPLRRISLYITDNSSTDDTHARLKKFIAENADRFRAIQLDEMPNRGFGAGHNHNISQGFSPFVLVTNVDLRFEKESIALAMEAASQYPAAVAAFEFRQKPYEHPKYYHPITLETAWCSNACVLFRREALETVGGYDETIFMYGEDVEISYRLRSSGYHLQYCPVAVVWHYCYQHENQIKPLQFRESLFANTLIRIRYGTTCDILEIPFMYFRLFKSPVTVPNQRKLALRALGEVMYRLPQIAFSRKSLKQQMGFIGWDYEIARHGAFFTARALISAATPKVSIVTRTCEGRIGWLKQSMASVLNQTYPNIELVVVEDGTNNATALIEDIRSKTGMQIVYVPAPKVGRVRAGNLGLASATGEWLIFLDDDDALFADHVETLMGEALANPHVDGVYSLAWEVQTHVCSLDPLVYEEKHFVLNGSHVRKFNRETLAQCNYIPIQCVMFHRRLYEAYGGFDENLALLEDWNLWYKYTRRNEFLFVEKITSIYRTPTDPQERALRQTQLDAAYPIAVARNMLVE
jgi:GT2 family glycosyltransferase